MLGWGVTVAGKAGSAAATATALTIAGFDPSSGAGVSADVLTFAAHGVFATAAITALTVQSTKGVSAVHPVAPELLRQTLLCLEEDLPPAGIKIGMLGSAEMAAEVAGYVRLVRGRRRVDVVLDPVLRSSSGASLLERADGRAADLLSDLIASVDVITPNLDEAVALTGLPCTTRDEMEACVTHLRQRYRGLTVVLTGGHLPQPADLLSDASGLHWFEGLHLVTSSTHGTGCAFSSALLAARLHGNTWVEATAAAKQFVAHGMRHAVPRGQGRGPLALVPQLEQTAASAP